MKRLICWTLILVMLLTAVPAMADNTKTSGQYTYEIKGNGSITITKFLGNSRSGDVYIPNMIDGYTVTAIGDEAFAQIYLKGCSVTLPDGIKSIGDKAFFDTGISAINLPSSLQRIGVGAFYNCTSCQFKLTPNHPYFAVIDKGLYDKTNKELITYNYGGLPDNAIIQIPDGIKIIGGFAFAGNYKNRLIIQLPSSLISIGDYAFAQGLDSQMGDNSWLQEISGNLSNLKTIGEGAFMNCHVFNCHITMSDVETIENKAFYGSTVMFMDGRKPGKQSYSIIFDGSPLNQIGDEAFDRLNFDIGGDICNYFSIDTTRCSNIGIGNSGIGMLLINENCFSPRLTTIPTGLNPKCSSLPSTVTAIQAQAYTDVVTNFRLSTSLTDIAVDAFPKGSTFIVDAGSYAELWCSENGFGYSIEGQDNLDWLNN